MERLINQVLDAYEGDLLDILEKWNVSKEDVLYALDELGFISLEDILEGWRDEEEDS